MKTRRTEAVNIYALRTTGGEGGNEFIAIVVVSIPTNSTVSGGVHNSRPTEPELSIGLANLASNDSVSQDFK